MVSIGNHKRWNTIQNTHRRCHTLETMVVVATERINLGLNSVPETMLWTLHNRCSVASKRDNGWFQDPRAVEIYQSIEYDYVKSFRREILPMPFVPGYSMRQSNSSGKKKNPPKELS